MKRAGRKSIGSIFASAVFVLALLLMLGSTAHAYIDPGAGSLLLQVLLGGLAAAFATISLYFARIKTMLSRYINRVDGTRGGSLEQ